MSTTCRRCGATLPPGASACPRCLFALGFPSSEPEPASDPRPSAAPRTPGPAPGLAELAPLFPQLELYELLGQGGMGVVYKARQRQLGRLVALKILPREASQDAAFVERFAREARALAQLDHPNIVRVHDHGEAQGYPYLVMEYVDGQNLRQRLRAGGLAPREALRLVPQICDALQYAHDEGVVHRDIKPENILLTREGRVKVADFGLARLTGEPEGGLALTRAGETVGTPHYMAPEQLERPREVDHRADIYALGVVFYELLTGTLPRGKFDAPSRRVEVDVRVDEIVLKSLEHEPERRYQHALEMKGEVQAAAAAPAAASGTAAASAPASAPAAPPRPLSWPRELVGWTAVFAFAWALFGWAFDGGWGWLVPAGLFLALLFDSAARVLSGAKPEWRAEGGWFFGVALAHRRRGAKAERGGAGRGLGFALALAALACLALGMIGLWETTSPGYAGPPDGLTHLGRALQADYPALLRSEGAGAGLDPERVRFEELGTGLLEQPGLLLAGAALLVLAGALAGAGPRVSRARAWAAAAAASACCLAPLALYQALTVAFDRAPVAQVSAAVETRSPSLAAALQTLPGCLADAGYATRVRAYVTEGEPGARTDPALVLAYAEPSSPLERWHLGLRGAERRRPDVLFRVRREAEAAGAPARLTVSADGGVATAEQAAEWNAWLEQLLVQVLPRVY